MTNGSEVQYCPKCGSVNPPGVSPCPKCSAKIGNPSELLNKDDKIEHHLALTILTALLCCMPVGVVGVIFSAMSISDKKNGDLEESRRKGRIAYKISQWTMLAGALVGVAYVLLSLFLRK